MEANENHEFQTKAVKRFLGEPLQD